MRTQRHLRLSVPIPANVAPSAVVASLHTVDPIIRHLGTLAQYEMVPTDPAAVANDPFFAAWDRSVFTFQFQDHIPLGPGLTKKIEYPAYFQLVPDGIRCRANAPAGVIVWSEFSVRPRQSQSPTQSQSQSQSPTQPQDQCPPTPTSLPQSAAGSGSSPASTVTDGDEYEFCEAALVEADSLLMPFVARSMASIHQELCHSVVDEMVKNYASSSPY